MAQMAGPVLPALGMNETSMSETYGKQSGLSEGGGPCIRTVVRVPLILSDRRMVSSEIISFNGLPDDREHFAVKLGSPESVAPLVRLHSECVTGDVLGSARCDCGPQLNEALHRLSETGGYLLYLRQEGRGIGLYPKLDAYLLQENGVDTFAANRALGRGDDERDYGAAVGMLNALGVTRITLLSNNPDKRQQLTAAGIDVVAQVPTGVFVAPHNRRYLEAKVRHSRHTIDLIHAEEMH
jgi:GTP cyclohydrolase II